MVHRHIIKLHQVLLDMVLRAALSMLLEFNRKPLVLME